MDVDDADLVHVNQGLPLCSPRGANLKKMAEFNQKLAGLEKKIQFANKREFAKMIGWSKDSLKNKSELEIQETII